MISVIVRIVIYKYGVVDFCLLIFCLLDLLLMGGVDEVFDDMIKIVSS